MLGQLSMSRSCLAAAGLRGQQLVSRALLQQHAGSRLAHSGARGARPAHIVASSSSTAPQAVQQQQEAAAAAAAAAAQDASVERSGDSASTSTSNGSSSSSTTTSSSSSSGKPSGRKVGAAGPPANSKKAAAAGAAAAMIDTSPPRGTRDFYPEDMRLRNWLFGQWAAVAEGFGFEQFDVPVLESEELFVRKAGEEITGQLYNFEDKGGRRVALRPEITPSLARLVLGKGKALPLPAKWWTVGQCWRYERMTRGRRREHYQWNMDVVGVAGVEAEAELLAAVTSFFSRVGLTSADVGIKVSSRKVLAAVLQRYGVRDEAFAPVCVVVDKLEKLPREKVEQELAALGVPPQTVDGILAALSCKSLDALGGLLGDAGADALGDLRQLWALADGYGYADWLVLDASVVRGLAYYTGVVFEGFDRAGQLRAICGGGRYDRLLGTFGAQEELPCAGFGFGDAVIAELLRDRGLLPSAAHRVDDVVAAVDEALRPAACGVAARLRAAGRSVDLVLEPRKMKQVFKQAERCGAARLLLVGGDEWARGAVAVKDLAARTQEEVPLEQLVPGEAAAAAAKGDGNGAAAA